MAGIGEGRGIGTTTERYSTAEGVDLTIISERSDEDGFDLLDVTVKVNPHGSYDLVDFTLIKGLMMLETQDGAGFRFSYQRDRRATETPVVVDEGGNEY